MTEGDGGPAQEVVLAHISGLHLGSQPPGASRADPGQQGTAAWMASLVDRLVESRVQLVVVTGNTFQDPHPSTSQLAPLVAGVRRLRESLPQVRVFVVEGWAEVPLVSGRRSAGLGVLDGLDGVDVVMGGEKTVLLDGLGVELRLVPAPALGDPHPKEHFLPSTDFPRRLLFLAAEGICGGPEEGLTHLDPGPWSYVGLGGASRKTRLGVGVHDPGPAVRSSERPWREAGIERGFLLVRLGDRLSVSFRTLPQVPLVDPAPIPWPTEGGLDRRIARALSVVPGGVKGKAVRLRINGGGVGSLPMDPAMLHRLTSQAAELRVQLPRPGGSAGRSTTGPPGSRTTRVLSAVTRDPLELQPGGYTLITSTHPLLLTRFRDSVGGKDAGGAFLSGRRLPRSPEALLSLALAHLEEARGASAGRDSLPPQAVSHDLMELRADAAEVQGDLEARTMDWLRERQDAETNLEAYRSRARELRERIREMESRGEAYPCPVCEKLLGNQATEVQSRLQEEWESVVQDGTWWKRRREQLELKPPALRDLERQALRLHARLESAMSLLPGGAEGSEPVGRGSEPFRVSASLEDTPVAGELLTVTGRLLNRLSGGEVLGVDLRRGRLLLDVSGRLRAPRAGVESFLLRRAIHLAMVLEGRGTRGWPEWVMVPWPFRRRSRAEPSFFATLARVAAALPPLMVLASPVVASRGRRHAIRSWVLEPGSGDEDDAVPMGALRPAPDPPRVFLRG